ncbi:MAG: hypothetical protein MMC33_008949 [Icmadophila ericetorum]|nr:hypothetical protein [Icmadophila ericetorum]
MKLVPSFLSPVPSFPNYTGPYSVGTLDVEIPTTELPSPAPAPDPTLTTISFRMFYPCEVPAKEPKPVYWISEPQSEYLTAYLRFLGASQGLAEYASLPMKLINHITIPAFRGAELLPPPTASKRWPVMIFSHGLGGTRNQYSHIVGLLASHGVVVLAPEHRDGSGPISFVGGSEGKAVEYKVISHSQSKEVEDARDEQLQTRLWEIGLTYEALLKIDHGERVSNIFSEGKQGQEHKEKDHFSMFSTKLDVNTPGGITFGGHSFGAATTVQFIKSVFYCTSSASFKTLYTPSESSSIVRQVTPKSTVVLLDPWALPLRSAAMRWLWEKPLPSYCGGQGGASVLAVLSEGFFKWRGNLVWIKRAVSEDPWREHPPFQQRQAPPHIFYPVTSAHLSQSDFGVLFAWLVKKAIKAQEPERTMRLNCRAILEVMRRNGREVADTSAVDMEENVQKKSKISLNCRVSNKTDTEPNGHVDNLPHPKKDTVGQDWKILAGGDLVRGWISLNVNDEDKLGEAVNEKTPLHADPSDAVIEGEVLSGKHADKQST